MTDCADQRQDQPLWRRFALSFAVTAAAAAACLYGFILVFDPYGLRAAPGQPATPIMDLNQRFMYPQIVRGGRFDAAVFGTSTVRLLDPKRLDAALGGRFANLGLNAGTPWEQMQLADLFLRHVPRPRALIFGLDTTWCEVDADEKTLTFRAFPPWLYDEAHLNDWPALMSLTSLEIAGRVALNRLGLMPERIRGDGYERFVPDEALYDLERARFHIWHQIERAPPPPTPVRLTAAERARLKLPALGWLDERLARIPALTAVTLAMMPIHVAWQPVPGTRDAAIDAECKARIAAIGASHGAAVIDFRIPSPVTTVDSNYWDPLHYRVGIAERVIAALKDVRAGGGDAPDGFYRVLNRPRP
jgi:hypothetical protein